MQIPISVALPLLGIGLCTLFLSFILCCYMWRLKRKARLEKGYKQILLLWQCQFTMQTDGILFLDGFFLEGLMNEIKYFQPSKQKFPNETCPVCLMDFELKENVLVCPCKHIFHQTCLIEWLQHKNACPLCKAPVQFFTDEHANLAGETTGLIPNMPMRVSPNV